MRTFVFLFLLLLLIPFVAFAQDAKSPLTDVERATFSGEKCNAYNALLKSAMTQAAGKPKPASGEAPWVTAMVEARKTSGISDADWNLCSGLAARAAMESRMRSMELDAKMTLRSMADGMTSAYAMDTKLCASSKKPVPADVKAVKVMYRFTKADWADPTWECLHFEPEEGSRQFFQYEVKTNAKAKSFELIAHGYPAGDEQVVTYVMTGKVVNGEVVYEKKLIRR